MIDDQPSRTAGAAGPAGPAEVVRSWVELLGSVEEGLDAAGCVELIGELETLKSAAEAAQAAGARRVHAATMVWAAAAGVPAVRRARGAAHEVGLARRVSPHRAEGLVALARTMPDDLPHCWAAWRRGQITEWRARKLAGATFCLSPERRLAVDAELAGTPERLVALVAMGEREAEAAATRHAYAADPAAWVRRRAAAEADRHVTSRPAPSVMMRLSALLPVTSGVAVMAALGVAAETAHAAGDPRSRSQLLADALVERLLRSEPGPLAPTATQVHVQVTMPLDTLLADGEHAQAPGWVQGHGQVPADLARDLAAQAAQGAGHYRRLLTDPVTGRLVAMESTARAFPVGLAGFIRSRDRYCRHPWCEAPIRHIDHVVPAAEAGATTADNGQGLCEACNHAKQAPGWSSEVRHDLDGTSVVRLTAPTGTIHHTRPPPAHPPRPAA